MSSTHLVTDIDYDRPGKQLGTLIVPQSTNTSGWASEYIPVAVFNGAPGPTALLFGGNHGDEYEGQVALMNFVRALDVGQLRGRVIVLPMLNRPAAAAGTRLSPIDGKNMNRSFPGQPDDTITGMIAHYVSSVLFPLADLVIDIHSGGRTGHFLPSVNMHLVPDAEQMRKMIAAGMAWGAPYVFIYRDVGGVGLLPGLAEQLGKVTLGTEMGGACQFGAEILGITERGVWNVLRHAGILVDRPPDAPATPAQVVAADQYEDYIMAPVSGIFEPYYELGDQVEAGQPVGRMHSLEQPFAEPFPVLARTSGMVMSRRSFPLTRQGEYIATLVRPFSLD